ncbi:hypothetical protein OG535_30380 [Kitasatospora sp. NBC_00085]|uniref:hypothetical protein n=1 Tax=unclassified Kitasatospora TaxID=2633591 RepID=UPI003250A844
MAGNTTKVNNPGGNKILNAGFVLKPGESVRSNASISLMPGGSGRHIACSIAASVQKDDGGMNLCLVEDLDQTCGDGQLLRKSSPG